MKRGIALLLAAALGVSGGLWISLHWQVVQIEDNSMMPTWEQGDWVLVRSIGMAGTDGGTGADRAAGTVARGDVVIFENPIYAATGEGSRMVKRVVAVGGDRIGITAGIVYVNGAPLAEPYVFAEAVSGEMATTEVPAGYVFVLGDNRAGSTDSRSETVGMVPESALLGKVVR